MGQASRIVLGSGFPPPTDNPGFLDNPNVGFPYGWNWTSGASVDTQAAGSSYPSFGHNLGGFNPSGGPPMGGSGGPFQSPPLGVGPNPKTEEGSNDPFKQPPLGPGQMPNASNQGVLVIPMGNPYQMGGYQPMSQPYRAVIPIL